jgi:hypothetical protein
MFKKLHTMAVVAAAGAGLLVASASPSLACIYVTANPSCHESEPQVTHGRALYDVVPGGMKSLHLSAPHRSAQSGSAISNSK